MRPDVVDGCLEHRGGGDGDVESGCEPVNQAIKMAIRHANPLSYLLFRESLRGQDGT